MYFLFYLFISLISLLLNKSKAHFKDYNYDNPQECLNSNLECNWERKCNTNLYKQEDLNISISFKLNNIQKISCCFKCIINFYEPQSPLVTNSTLLSEFNQIKNLNYPDEKKILLISKKILFLDSHYIIFNSSYTIGNPNQYTITSVNTPHHSTWLNIEGRSLLFINTNKNCVSTSTVKESLLRVGHAFNSFIKIYYSYQLPCQFNLKETGKWQDKIKLIPIGVRSPNAISITMKYNDQNNINIIHQKSNLIDCTCAQQSSTWNNIQQLISNSLCSSSSTTTLPDITSETNNEEIEKFVENYKKMQTFKYILSPSITSELSHCEWEGLALGAIPIIDITLINNNKIKELYDGLPIYFTDLSKLTSNDLELNYNTLINKFIDNTNQQYSLSKLYYPYWLGTFKKYMITGKPPQRVWENIDKLINNRKKISNCQDVDKRDPNSFEKFGNIGGNTITNSHQRYLQKKNKKSSDSLISDSLILNNDLNKKYYPKLNYHLNSYDQSNLLTESRKSNLQLEIVLPRCCEEGDIEFNWIQQLLSVTSEKHTGVTFYYKCPSCLPKSMISKWLQSKNTPLKRSDLINSKGIHILDDSKLLSYGNNRVIQRLCIDRIHNGKEVTAYLKHIVDYYDTLADQTIFLHTVPHSHIHFDLFYKLIAWSEQCRNISLPIDFIHLNVHYKTMPHLWTSCCGCKPWGPGSCRVATWKYLFHDYPKMGPDYVHAYTYSSAQFAVSKRTLHHWPRSFYERMLSAINGTHDLEGCCHSSSAEKWGGHSLTGQYERMWHIIFGHTKFQKERKNDNSIPSYLRLDCDGDQKCSIGAL